MNIFLYKIKRKPLKLALVMAVVFLLNSLFAGVSLAAADVIPEGYTAIYTAEELAALNENGGGFITGNYILMNDIVFSPEDFQEGGAFYNDGTGWIPIGANGDFNGIFDGNGHKIINLYVNRSGNDTVVSGLFGYNTGIIKNLTVEGGYIRAESSVEWWPNALAGGIVAHNQGSIYNCHSSAEVIAEGVLSCSGGITGMSYTSYYCEIVNCSNSGTIKGDRTGGIIGWYYVAPTLVKDCKNSGEIISEDFHAGGIIGYAETFSSPKSEMSEDSKLQVIGCYNTGSVTAVYSGGIIGEINAYGDSSYSACVDSICSIDQSYNSGTISGSYRAGGITSYATTQHHSRNGYNEISITNCFNIGNIAGSTSAKSGIAAEVSAYAKASGTSKIVLNNCYNFSSVRDSSDGITNQYYKDNYSILEVNNCYDIENNNASSYATQKDYYNVEKLSFSDFSKSESFQGFDFTEIWQVKALDMFPSLKLVPLSYKRVNSFSVPELYVIKDWRADIKCIEEPMGAVTNYSYYSINDNIATVSSNGTVSGIEIGETNIVVTENITGKQSICTIKVVQGIESVTVSGGSQVAVGETLQLTALVTPETAFSKEISWYSSNEAIAKVDDKGLVTGISKGSATIRADSSDGRSIWDSITVKVVQYPSSIKTEDTMKISLGDTFTIPYQLYPDDVNATAVKVSSSNEDVVQLLDNNNFYAKGVGTSIITFETENGLTAQCTITVGKFLKTISFESNPLYLGKGFTKNIGAVLNPVDAEDVQLNYLSSDTSVATVSEAGIITGVSLGSTIINVSNKEGTVQAKLIVYVENPVTEIGLSESNLRLKIGDTSTLEAKLISEGEVNSGIQWVSSNTDIVQVTADGQITALEKGAANIRAYAKDGSGVYGQCQVTIIPDEKPIISAEDKTVIQGMDYDVAVGITAYDYEDGDISSAILVESTVDVSKPGSYTVVYSVADSDGNISDKNITVTVLKSDWYSHWGRNYIKSAMENSIVDLSANFRPEDPVTRAEFIKLVNRTFGYTEAGKISYTDVKPEFWYYKEVQIAAKSGYISTANKTFRPNDPISREEVAVIICNLLNCRDDNLDKLQGYTDMSKVSSWARSSVEGAIEAGYMGQGSIEFRPLDRMVRAEAVTALSRIK